jgi:hypothetical protein
MSHKNPLRKDKTCLNCNHVVDSRYCPNCGQENTDTRKTFHHLFIHFFEDLTHYENAFWKTIKNLLLRPASLTKEYLSGKRLSYLAPVRLYIFISFVTFFLLAVFPDEDNSDVIKVNNLKVGGKVKTTTDTITQQELKIDELAKKGAFSKTEADSLKKLIKEAEKDPSKDNFINLGYSSIEKMDSIRKVNPGEINDLEYWLSSKIIPINKKYTNEEIKEKFIEGVEHNFPKTLFIFMPIFAFVLWLFHNKKRFYYFDHGIFTLHYFSFLLLIVLLLFLLSKILYLFGDSSVISGIDIVINTVGYIWMFYYFFPAHHRFYGETRFISFIKSSVIFILNLILFTFLIILFVLYTLINIH